MKYSAINQSFEQPKHLFLIFIIVAIVTFVLLLGFAYFPGNFDESIIKIYYADNISPAHQVVIDNFNEQYQDEIEIVPIDLPFIKFNTNLRKELLARSLRNQNSLIDVFAIDQVWNSRFSVWAESLDSYFSEATLKSLLPNVLANAYSDSILVSIPLHTDVGVLYFRRDLIDKIDPSGNLENALKSSMSWSDFIELGLKYNSHHKFYCFQAFNYEGLSVNFMEIIGPKKTKEIFDIDSLKINVELTKQGTEFLYKLIYTYKLSPIEVTSFNENRSYEHALQNNIPFMRGWPTFYQTIKNKSMQNLIGIAALPHANDEPASSVLGGWNLMISKHSKVKREAAIFLNYMISPEVQKTMLKVGGFLPVVSTIYSDTEILREIDYLPYFKRLVDNGFYRPAVSQYTQLSKSLADSIHWYLTHALANPD
ncbi:MAG: extracellular solute-binding protein [Planctomycetia bacterium]|nr:extracellular solute-binding protein [Planctomycetia bacterium]